MFVRPCWRPQSPDETVAIIDNYPWALLVNNGEDGPFVTNLPLLLDRTRGPRGSLAALGVTVLEARFAANPGEPFGQAQPSSTQG